MEKQRSNKQWLILNTLYMQHICDMQYMCSSQSQGCFIDAEGVVQMEITALQNIHHIKIQNKKDQIQTVPTRL